MRTRMKQNDNESESDIKKSERLLSLSHSKKNSVRASVSAKKKIRTCVVTLALTLALIFVAPLGIPA